MDARDHLNNQVIEIIEELANRAKSRALRNQQLKENKNTFSADNKVVPIRPDQEGKARGQDQNNEPVKTDPNSLKSLLAARHNLYTLRERLNKDPEKNKAEIEKLNKVELKLNGSINKAQKKEITLAIENLKREPRRYVLKLADTKSKIELLKMKLESNPRLYRMHIEKLEKLEKAIDKKIDLSQVKTLRSALNSIQKNPEKYRKEIDRYDEMEKTLNKGLNQNNQKDLQKEKQNEKQNEKTQKQERTRNDLELSR